MKYHPIQSGFGLEFASHITHMMTIADTNATHCYQRPPSVGMPRHALRRRMPNTSYRRPLLPLGAGISIRSGKMRAVGEGPGRAQGLWFSSFGEQGIASTISETIRQNWLKFCMWLPMDIVRTNPYWRFAGKNQNVGQKCDFPTKFLTFFSLTVKILPQGHARYPKPC